MNKNIVCFDVETTGLSKKTDYIIQLAMVKVDAQTLQKIDSRNWYIKPAHAYEISQGAFEAHGLTKEFIEANGVNIKDIAPEIIKFVEDSDYLTYNGNSFDVEFVYKDLALFGFNFPIEGKVFYDAFSLYRAFNPATLSAVYKRYTGKELEGAHDAFADVNATIEVFGHLRNEANSTNEDLAGMDSCQLISPENSIRRALNGDLIFCHGKYKDAEFCEVYRKDPGYVSWFGANVATPYTKRLLNKYATERMKKEIKG